MRPVTSLNSRDGFQVVMDESDLTGSSRAPSPSPITQQKGQPIAVLGDRGDVEMEMRSEEEEELTEAGEKEEPHSDVLIDDETEETEETEEETEGENEEDDNQTASDEEWIPEADEVDEEDSSDKLLDKVQQSAKKGRGSIARTSAGKGE